MSTLDLHIYENIDFELMLTLEDEVCTSTVSPTGKEEESCVTTVLDLTGYSVTSKVKADFSEDAPTLLQLGTLIPDPSAGVLWLTAPAALTKQLTNKTDPEVLLGYYDIVLTKGSAHSYLVGGKVFYHQVVSRG